MNVDEACKTISDQTCLLSEARSVLKLISDCEVDDSVHLENAAIIVSKILEEVATTLDEVEHGLKYPEKAGVTDKVPGVGSLLT